MAVSRFEVATRPDLADPRGLQVADKVRRFLNIPIGGVRTREVYRVEAELDDDERARVLAELVDPAAQVGSLDRLEGNGFDYVVHVGFKPGVTDPVGKSARVAIEDTLQRSLGEAAAVYSSRLYLLGGVDREQAQTIAEGLLANPIIQTLTVEEREAWLARPADLEVPKVQLGAVPAVARVDLSGDDAELARISREGLLALSLAEMRAIRDHFRGVADDPARKRLGLDGSPTDVELECLAQTWSEHCSHKIFNATITYTDGESTEVVPSLFKRYIRRATEELDEAARADGTQWLVSVFHDNAGAVRFDDEGHLVYKVETHNSPSALDPYGGAMTGIVGVNRDPFGTGRGCDLLTNVWGYCFGDPDYEGELPSGLMHPRRIRDGVHEGVIDGGNQSGVPYGRGWELFDDRFLGKPLVFCGTVGMMPVEIDGRPGEEKRARPGDLIVMTGGRIGADGIHGATFSSAQLDESAPVQAVQIGDPITQKKMFDFLLEAREQGLYEAITDNGAGGLSSSVGEMAEGPGGARMDLSKAPLKYPGLAPWEILVSEAQERMTLAVAPDKIEAFLELARRREVEASVLGEFTDDGFFHVLYGEETVARLSMEFLHDGAPDLDLKAEWKRPRFEEPTIERERDVAAADALLALLGRTNVRSGERKARHYDHEVKGLAVVKPFVGRGRDIPAEATVFMGRHGSERGYVLSEGVNPFYSDIDCYHMARAVVDLAVRRQLCAGASRDRIALLDNFCWPDPVQSEHAPDGAYKAAQLVRACKGLYEAVHAYRAPLVSGKDSMKNDSVMGGVKISVPPTLLVSAIGQIEEVGEALTLDLKLPGDVVYLLGETKDECGGSEYFRWLGRGERAAPGDPAAYVGNAVPRFDLDAADALYAALECATATGAVHSLATPALGGWALTWARMAMAGRLGMELDVQADPQSALSPLRYLFSESCARFSVAVAADRVDDFEACFDEGQCVRVGTVTEAPTLNVRRGGVGWLDVPIDSLLQAFGAGGAR